MTRERPTKSSDSTSTAYRRNGQGNHPASLNICDCCAYALSKISGQPLLFKGADFTATDAVPSLKDAGEDHSAA
jgi:ribonuclease VapC